MSVGAIGMQTPLTMNRQNQFIWGGPKAEILEMDEIVDATAIDAGSWNQSVLRAGMGLGQITSTGRLKQWDLDATDGSQNLYGFLKTEAETIDRYFRAKRDFHAVIVKAPVKSKAILYKGVTIVGHAAEGSLRSQIRRRFRLDDEAGVDASATNAFHTRQRFTIAQVNAGATVLPAVPLMKYRLLDASMIAIGGNAGGTTGVRLRATQAASGVTLFDAKVAGLLSNVLLRIGTATNGLILASGASFIQNDADTPITVIKDGSDLTTATHIDVLLSYELAP